MPAQSPPAPLAATQGAPQPSSAVVDAVADTLALAATVTPTTLVAMLAAILGSTGVALGTVRAVLYLVLRGQQSLGQPPSPGPALQATLNAERAYRAAYLANAAVRVQNAVNGGATMEQAIAGEQRFYTAHLQAQANRRRAAAAVDKVAEDVDMQTAYGPAAVPGMRGTVRLAGWKATIDARTSPECAAANGCNFDVERPPLIGYPGTVHPHCRCRAVKPYRHARVLDTLSQL